jgi:hypothetical protein
MTVLENNDPPTPGCTAGCLRSTTIDLRSTPNGVNGLVTVADENGAVVSGATVSAMWSLPDGGSQTQNGETNTSGVVSFRIASTTPGTYTLTITDITLTDFTFDPDNSVVSQSIVK